MRRKRKSPKRKYKSIWNNYTEPTVNLSTSSSSSELTIPSNIRRNKNKNRKAADMSNNHAASRINPTFNDVDYEISHDVDKCIRDHARRKSKLRSRSLNRHNKVPINVQYDQINRSHVNDYNKASCSYSNSDIRINEHLQTCKTCKDAIYSCIDMTDSLPIINRKRRKNKRFCNKSIQADSRSNSDSELLDSDQTDLLQETKRNKYKKYSDTNSKKFRNHGNGKEDDADGDGYLGYNDKNSQCIIL